MELESYITGFVDGEGSFLVSFSRRPKLHSGVEVRPSFTVSQHERSRKVLEVLKEFFSCGSIRYNRSDRTWKYEVRSLIDLITKIIPHFQQFPLQTSKQNDFKSFEIICACMNEKRHHQVEGLHSIIEYAYTMNNFGPRRYMKDYLLKITSKMKV